VRTGYHAFNVKEDEIQIGNIPYPLADFYKLSTIDQLGTGIALNIDEPITLGYIIRKFIHE